MPTYTVDIYPVSITDIRSGDPDTAFLDNSAFGKGTAMTGITRSFLMFDMTAALSAFSGINVTAASLLIYWSSHIYAEAYPCTLYRVKPTLLASAPPTYNKYDQANAWPGSAGAHTSDTDYYAANSVAFATSLQAGGPAELTGLGGMVATTTTGILGIMPVTDSEAVENIYHWATTTDPTVSHRPFLRVTFTATSYTPPSGGGGTFELGLADTFITDLDPAGNHSADNPIGADADAIFRAIYCTIDLTTLPATSVATNAWLRFFPPPPPTFSTFTPGNVRVLRATVTGVTSAANWLTKDGSVSWTTQGGGASDFDVQGSVLTAFNVDPILGIGSNAYALTGLTDLVNSARNNAQTEMALKAQWDPEGNSHTYLHTSADSSTASLRPKLMVVMGSAIPAPFNLISPSDGATTESTCGPTLDWSDSVGATSYSLYFGTTNPPPLYASGLTESFFDLPILAPNTTCYWYVVATNAAGTYTTAQWSFTTIGTVLALISPSPADAATGVAINPPLDASDISSPTGITYNLFIWKNGDAVPTSPVVSGFQLGDHITDTLSFYGWQYSTVYKWRIDSVYSCQTVTGTVWTFTTAAAGGGLPGPPTNPSPGAAGTCTPSVSIATAGISWTNGALTVDCVVDIQDGDPGLLFSGIGGTLYTPAVATVTFASEGITLQYGHTYYWQVIDINATGQTAGPIWCFTVQDNPNPPGGFGTKPFRNRIRPFKRDLRGFGFSGAPAGQ